MLRPLLRWTLIAVLAHATLDGRPASAQSLCDTPQCQCDDAQLFVQCECRKAPQEPQVQTNNNNNIDTFVTDVTRERDAKAMKCCIICKILVKSPTSINHTSNTRGNDQAAPSPGCGTKTIIFYTTTTENLQVGKTFSGAFSRGTGTGVGFFFFFTTCFFFLLLILYYNIFEIAI